MGFKEFSVNGYKEYINLFTKLSADSKNRIVTLFFASPDATGKSWCGDCRNALPVINEAIEAAKKNNELSWYYIFACIEREDWRNKENDFRQNPELKLTNLPTLILWENGKEQKRLTEGECSNKENLLLFFS